MYRDLRRRGESTDAGFTFVELVVALTILAVGIVGVIGVTNSSFRVAGGASAKSKMVAIATKEIEALRAIPYSELNCSTSTTTTSTSTTSTTTQGRGCVSGYSTWTDAAGGISYTVERTVQPVSATAEQTAAGVPADQHREAIVAVTWSDQSGAHEVWQSTFLYPGGIGPANPTATSTPPSPNCSPPQPTSLTATQVMDATQITSTVDLAWTAGVGSCPVTNYVIQYVTGVSSIWNELTRLPTSTAYRVTGLTAGTQYRFQVAARSASGNISSWSNIASVTTQVYSASTCRIGTITLTPPTANKKGNGLGSGLRDPVSVRVPTEGSCPGFNAVYKPTATTTQTTGLVLGSDGAYTGSLNKDVTWDVGRRYVDIIRVGDNVKVGSVLLTVCEHNVSNCA